MIFDRKVIFISKANRRYNPKTHSYEGKPTQSRAYRANITDVGTNRSAQVLGNYKQKAKVVRLTKEPPKEWDYLKMDGDDSAYVLETDHKPLKYFTLIVGESNENNG